MAYIGNFSFNGNVTGANVVDGTIAAVDLSASAIADKLGFTPVNITAGSGINITGGVVSVATTIDYGLITGQLTITNDYGSV